MTLTETDQELMVKVAPRQLPDGAAVTIGHINKQNQLH